MKRTNREYLILVLSAFASLAITPFAIIRFMSSEWGIGIVDSFIGFGMAAIFIYVIRTRQVRIPSLALVIFSAVSVVISIHTKGVDNIYWLYPSIVVAYYLLSPKIAITITTTAFVFIIPTLVAGLDSIKLTSVVATSFMTSLFGFFFSTSVRDQRQRLVELATKDSLTGSRNRRALTDRLQEIITNQSIQFSTISLIMLDIDHFKKVNDDHGHLLGDAILKKVAEIIDGRIRVTDALYRFGGEEFVIVPLEINLEDARKLAEQLRVLVENNALIPDSPVTISLGVAEYQKNETSDNWLKRADDALYHAKENGRNQVCVAD